MLVLLLAADERLIRFGWASEQVVTILKVLSNPVRQEPRAFLSDPKLSVDFMDEIRLMLVFSESQSPTWQPSGELCIRESVLTEKLLLQSRQW